MSAGWRRQLEITMKAIGCDNKNSNFMSIKLVIEPDGQINTIRKSFAKLLIK